MSTKITNTRAKDLPIGAFFYGGYSGDDVGNEIRDETVFQRIKESDYVKKVKCYHTEHRRKEDRRHNIILTVRIDCGEIYSLSQDDPVHHIQEDLLLVRGKS